MIPFLAAPTGAGAETIELLNLTNHAWGFNYGSDLGTAWRDVGFDDSAWEQGRGLFGTEDPGVYPYALATAIPPTGQGGPAVVYFRTEFQAPEDATNAILMITNWVDDANAIYLNGVEIARFNVSGEPGFLTRAEIPVGFNPGIFLEPNLVVQEVDLSTFDPSPLRNGSNLLAVSVHQNSEPSSDMVFGLSLHAQLPTPLIPKILIQPQDRSVHPGQFTTFLVSAEGIPPLSYQWYFNATNALPNATRSTFVLFNIQESHAGDYHVVVSNDFGAVTSQVAVLSVVSTPLIQIQPQSQVVRQGEHVTFKMTATGPEPLSYQWWFNMTNAIPGASDPTLTLTNVQLYQQGDYLGVVSNDFGAITSQVATLTVFGPFAVSNTDDAGPGSLRQAILDANEFPGLDRIHFALPTNGLLRIEPNSALPIIMDPVVIDGATQPGFAGQPLIELHGNLAGPTANGLWITAENVTIRGLVINDFAYNAIYLDGSRNTVIQGNFLGTDTSGTSTITNGLSGILMWNSTNTMVGGASASMRNLISGNGFSSIRIFGTSRDARIEGNYIGTDVTGTAALGNFAGIYIRETSGNTIGGDQPGQGNLISGNSFSGVEVRGSQARSNVIAGNLIGTDVTGSRAMGNGWGVLVQYEAMFNRIGGTEPGARNVIAGGTAGPGIVLEEASQFTIVQGNFIGTDITGTVALGNEDSSGILIDNSDANRIGGTAPGAGNLLSGNMLSGVKVRDGSFANRIQGNLIGTDITGTNALGNGEFGVAVLQSSNTFVGGTNLASRNIIAHNAGDGVHVEDGIRNLVRYNRILLNGGLGINLGSDGVTPNDIGDTDFGANNLQNHPVLERAAANADGSVTVTGSLESALGTFFILDFYGNAECDPSGHGEGAEWLGGREILTGAGGNVSFEVTLAGGGITGQYVTATATDPFLNTSEFSACVLVVPPMERALLSVGWSGDALTVTWMEMDGFALYCTSNLVGPILWTPATNEVIAVDGTNTVVVTPQQQSQFFTLLSP